MLVKEAIEQLQKFPPNMELVISTPDAPEFGVEPLEKIEEIVVAQLDGPGGDVLAKVPSVVLRGINDPDNE
jgi:hypothetical protein